MDPNKQLSQLDPKIKEAYDRVMNVSLPTPPTPGQPAAPTPQKPAPPPQSMPVTQPPPAPVAQTPSVVVTPQTQQAPVSRREPERIHVGGSLKGYAAVQKKGPGISPVIYIIGGILFLVVYIIFWLKFFGVAVPFLP